MTSVNRKQSPADVPPWYKQFWPWVLIGIPGAAVIGCAFTIYLAVTNQDSLVTGDYYRVGVTINTALAELDLADQLGVRAELPPIKDGQLQVQLPAAGLAKGFDAPAELTMLFRHPTQADKDFAVALPADSQAPHHYSGTLGSNAPAAIDGRWLVVLTPAAAEPAARWRLEATWREPQQQGLVLGRSGP